MRKFPNLLRPENKENFSELYKTLTKSKLRYDLFMHVISKKESEYFSLDEFGRNRNVTNMELIKELVDDVIPELEEIGWHCKLSFGGTGLFIYHDKKPANCWEDEL